MAVKVFKEGDRFKLHVVNETNEAFVKAMMARGFWVRREGDYVTLYLPFKDKMSDDQRKEYTRRFGGSV